MKKILSKIKRFIKEYWQEGVLLAAVIGFVTIGYYFTYERPEDRFAQSFMILGLIAFAVLGVIMFRRLWKKKWKDAATERLQKVFSRLQRLLDGVSKKLGFGKRIKKSVLSGETKIIFEKKGSYEGVRANYEQKMPKWRQLRDNRSRMRYLYRNMMTEKIRRGESVYAFDTPLELSERKNNTAEEQRLFDLYIECRYDERKAPEPIEIARIKRELDIK